MKLIVAAIEYRTPHLIDKFINEWIKCEFVVKIYVASTSNETLVNKLCNTHFINNVEIYYYEFKNNGYGNAMNALVDFIRSDKITQDNAFDYLLIGNIDVFPISINIPTFIKDFSKIPMINVIENNQNRNPFLTKFQKKYLFLYKLPLIFNSIPLLYVTIFVFKFLGLFKSEPWSVHGSFFCLNDKMIISNLKFFNKSFLYCEELFYARNIEKLNIKLIESEINVKHIGGASTNLVINNNRKIFFKYWKESMREYFQNN